MQAETICSDNRTFSGLGVSERTTGFDNGICRHKRPLCWRLVKGRRGTPAPRKPAYEPFFPFLSIKTACCHRLGALSVR